MIVTKTIEINNKKFKKTYSDSNKIIRKVGTDEEYDEAIDVLTATWTYEETDKDIEHIEENEQAD